MRPRALFEFCFMHVRTPCVGLCSTSIGDLVCRGCKRWAHEVVGWNGFDNAQKALVLERLDLLRSVCVSAFVTIEDTRALRARAGRLGLVLPQSDSELVLALLRRGLPAEEIGCRRRATTILNGRALYLQLESELLLRAEAAYELSMRVPVR